MSITRSTISIPRLTRFAISHFAQAGLIAAAAIAVSVLPAPLPAQEHAALPLPEMHWRNIGPFRGGRTRAATGVPGQPNVLESDLRRTAVAVDRRDRGCSFGCRRGVCGERGGPAPA
jgi:hypothetical protein